jgi:hypothetical protein
MKNQIKKRIVFGVVVLMMSGMFSGVNSIQAACEVEAKVRVLGFLTWVTVYKCDSTPNETCSAEGEDDEGVAYSFSCDGKETVDRFGEGNPTEQ